VLHRCQTPTRPFLRHLVLKPSKSRRPLKTPIISGCTYCQLGHLTFPQLEPNKAGQTRPPQQGDIEDISLAIQHQKKAISITPEGHFSLPSQLNILGISFQICFEHLGDIGDLNMANQHQDKAINTMPEDHRHLSKYLNNFGNSF
jgi:hypothetical protein